jgi:hypothetical protein
MDYITLSLQILQPVRPVYVSCVIYALETFIYDFLCEFAYIRDLWFLLIRK